MSWSFSQTGTPAEVKAAFEQHISDNPLQGHEKVIRGKLVDVLAEAKKGYALDAQMEFSASGSASIVDGNEVSQTLNVSMTPIVA
jgi:hypothetical protein